MAVAKIVDIVLTFYYWAILIRALISWVNPDPYNPIVRFLHSATEPVLAPIRRLLPMMAIDFSPIIAFFAIVFFKTFLVQSIIDLAMRMR